MPEAKKFLADLLHLLPEDLDQTLKADYTYTSVRKRNGDRRKISIPAPVLKKVQRRILRRIFYRLFAPLQITGFHLGASIVNNARQHLTTTLSRGHLKPFVPQYVMKIDLKDAFGAVSETFFHTLADTLCKKIPEIKELRKLKMRLAVHRRYVDHFWSADCLRCNEINNENWSLVETIHRNLDRILRSKKNPEFRGLYQTWLKLQSTPKGQLKLFGEEMFDFPDLMREIIYLLIKLCFHEGSLPQGAPTSPYLLNLALEYSGLIDRLQKITNQIEPFISFNSSNYFQFTIYADDITFSSSMSFRNQPFKNDKRILKDILIDEIERDGIWKVNQTKTREYNFKREMPLITGLRLTPKGPIIPKKKIRYLRSLFYKNRTNTDPKMIAVLNGWRGYLYMIYGDDIPNQLGNIY